jgi:hypothetical protein
MSEHDRPSADLHDRNYVVTPSAGVGTIMYLFLAISLIVIFWQGSNVVSSAGAGKVWPASDGDKIQLPAYKP